MRFVMSTANVISTGFLEDAVKGMIFLRAA